MPLFYTSIRVDGTEKVFEGFVEAPSAQDALDKAEAFLSQAPLLGKFHIRVVGDGTNMSRSGETET